MPRITVTLNRTASGEQRQSELDKMAEQLRSETVVHGAPSRLAVEGINPYDNQFPEWLQTELENNGFEFDDINLYYQRDFDTMGAARKFTAFWNQEFKPFFAQSPEKYFLLQSVAVQVLDDHPSVEDVVSF